VEKRKSARYRIKGEAFWSTARMEGACRVLDISPLGVGISDPVPSVEVGDQLEITLLLGDDAAPLPSIRVKVIHTARGLGLAFVRPDPRVIARIEELTQDLTPMTESTWLRVLAHRS
jgi:hypothetical protein